MLAAIAALDDEMLFPSLLAAVGASSSSSFHNIQQHSGQQAAAQLAAQALDRFLSFLFLFHEKSVPLSLSSIQRAFSVCVFLFPFLCCCAKKSNIRQHLLFMKIVPTHFPTAF